MACPPVAAIVDCAAGRLAPDERAALEAHAADCAECRVALSELARARVPDGGGAPEPLRPSLPRGAAVGRYQVGERLGAGAMGVVYAAHDPRLDRAVALKLLHGHARADAGEASLLDEARALARVSHPNVVAIYDAGLFDGRPYLVMERVDGTTLRAWLARPRPWRAILDVFADAARGLAAAHAAGITHRDFKPANVLVGSDGRARVTDFGLARMASACGDALAGTPAYMAPEQLAGGGADARSDQFAFAVALWEALYGARPFSGDDAAALAADMRARRPTPPPSSAAPRRVARALARGLALDPAARFPSLTALLAALAPPPRGALFASLALLVATAGAALLWYHEIPPVDRTCRIETRRLGELWRERRPTLARALTGDQLRALDGAADAWLGAWVTARIGACEDAKAGDARGRARFARRRACFEEGRARLAAILDGLARPGADPAAARAALASLPPPARCLDD